MNTIEITVEGGLIQSISNIPKNVRIRVMDFDTNEIDENRVSQNSNGDYFVESIWEN